jgi:hypothetical protein
MNRKRGKRSGRVLFGGRENRGGIQTRNLLHVKKKRGGRQVGFRPQRRG